MLRGLFLSQLTWHIIMKKVEMSTLFNLLSEIKVEGGDQIILLRQGLRCSELATNRKALPSALPVFPLG